MPQKDDSLNRLQEELSRTLMTARQLHENGDTAAAMTTLQGAQRSMVGLESGLLRRLSSADLRVLLGGAGGTPDVEKCLQCAELLSAEHELRTNLGEDDSAQARKALELYLYVLEAEPEFAPHYSGRLRTLTRSLGYAAPPPVQAQLIDAYLHAGRFDEAENWLYRLLNAEPEVARARAEAFYRELLTRGDAALAAGGLPRAEVEEGLANVARRVSV
jgi:tetratricopeptide (TPR) repeat protein